MKRLLIILLLIISILLIGCTSQVIADTTVSQTTTTINELADDYDKLRADYEDLFDKNIKYEELINNLNNLLGNVYYGYSKNENYENEFTAFSIYYNGKYYLITAGHAVEQDGQKYTDFKFKANFTDEWIYPELLAYKNNFLNKKDYAVFYSDKISDGFDIDIDKDIPLFVINNLNLIRSYTEKTIEGESGSPVIDIEGEITNIVTTDMYGYYTEIETVLYAIDNLR